MLRTPILFATVALLAVPAAAAAADTPLTGLSATSGSLLAAGPTTISATAGARPAVARLQGTAFVPLPTGQGRILDLGTGHEGGPVLVRAGCAGGLALCVTRLAGSAPVRTIGLVDRRHCRTTGAAIDHGHVALAVVARPGRAGQRCHAGVYLDRTRRSAVRRWRVGNPVEVFRVDVTLDLRGHTALVRVAQSSFEVGDSADTIQQLRTVSLTSGRSHTLATATAVENDTDGELLSDAAIGSAGVTAVGQCRQGDGAPTTTEVLRWPVSGGSTRALTDQPFPDIAAAAAGARGLVLRAADGSAVLRGQPAFASRPQPPTLNCRLR